MSLVTRFCGVCGDRVPPSALDAGRAVIANDVTYCEVCAERAGLGGSVSVRPARASTFAPESRAPRRSAPGLGRPPRSAAPAIAIAVGVAFVVVVIGVIAWPNARRGTPPSPPPADSPGERPAAPEEIQAASAAAAASELVTGRLREAPDARASLERLIAHRDALRDARAELRRFDEAGLALDVRSDLEGRLERAEAAAAARVDRLAEAIWTERRSAVDSFLDVRNYDRALSAISQLPAGFERTAFAERVDAERERIDAARRRAAEAEATHRDEGWEYLTLALRSDGWHTDDALRWKLDLDDATKRVRSIEGFERRGGSGWLVWDGGARRWSRLRFDLRVHERGLALLLGTGPTADGATRIVLKPDDYPEAGEWTTIEVLAEDGRWEIRLGPRALRHVTRQGTGTGVGFELLTGSRFEIRNVRVRGGS